MCGICVSVILFQENESERSHHFSSPVFEELERKLKNRGPNYFQKISTVYNNTSDILFCSSVLHFQGDSIQKQPLQDDSGNILLWNGEIFSGPLVEVSSKSDTKIVAEKFFSATSVVDLLQIIGYFEGPYAFIFYQNNGHLWFGRDIFGRRSLLWKFEDFHFQLCSVASEKANWKEVPANGIFCLDLDTSINKKTFAINKYLWSSSPSGMTLKEEVNEMTYPNALFSIESQIYVESPLKSRLNLKIPPDEPSDFFKLIKSFEEYQQVPQELLNSLLDLPLLGETVDNLDKVLSRAVQKRINNELLICKNCYLLFSSEQTSNSCDHSSIGILFSGGLDSIVIAVLVDRHLLLNKPIDLINVAFANSQSTKDSGRNVSFDTPDRISGRNGFKALRKICPHRIWNFVEVNIKADELKAKRKEFISDLLYPSYTVLDDSIGCALWFAARAKGIICYNNENCSYTSPVRILFVGMGADEQLAGYSRHRAKFSSAGWNGLIQELSLELDRICYRNLGRDDRIIADNGVESRYPFLDENVVSFLNSLPIWLKANLNFSRGVGEKLLLRLLATKYGLSEAAVLPKRAIQFGSRIARIENSKEKGSDICERI